MNGVRRWENRTDLKGVGVLFYVKGGILLMKVEKYGMYRFDDEKL
jgi:hypothetical protein